MSAVDRVRDAGPFDTSGIASDIAHVVPPDTGRYWYAAWWNDEAPAKAAWEEIQRTLRYIGAFRTVDPGSVVAGHHVWLVAEEAENLVAPIEVIDRYGGRSTPASMQDLETVRSLRLRRLDQAFEAIASGRVDPKITIRSPGGRVMDREGRMRPHRRGQG